jgi:hypothetical protein
MFNRNRTVKVFLAVLGVLTCTGPALAGGGNVLPPTANAKGFSLSDIAVSTAFYNVEVFMGDSPAPPDVPFQVLVGDTTVKPGTMLYLPIFFADDSPPAPGFGMPTDADYLAILSGVEAFIVEVDGKTTILDDDYVTGVTTEALPDGGGTQYISSACFLTPLTPGEHTVSFGGIIDGEPVVFVSYDVTVR